MKKVIGLCEGRHEIPEVNGNYIFGEVSPENMFDFQWQEEQIALALRNTNAVSLYVTGLTVLTVSVCKYCVEHSIELTLYHFDRDCGKYVPQQFNS